MGDAVALSSGYGLTPDPWQHLVLEDWLGVDAGGLWAAQRCGLAVPRQNGKNGCLEIRELYGMVINGEKIGHTAHEVKTARKAFLRLASFFDNPRQYPELHALLKPNGIRRANGQEAIELVNGGSCEFLARSRGSGRGFTFDTLICDEAQELTDEQQSALLPTISSPPLGNSQLILTGTPPAPGVNGEVWVRMRAAGLEAAAYGLSWLEWSHPPAVDLDDEAAQRRVNPAAGGRLSMLSIIRERAAMDDRTFARERMGVWDDPTRTGVIPYDRWAELVDGQSVIIQGPSLGLHISPDRRQASIVAVGPSLDGLVHCERIPPPVDASGISWVTDAVVAVCNGDMEPRRVVIDQAGPAASLIPELVKRGVTVVTTNAREMGLACAMFYDAVMGDPPTLRHVGQASLTAAVAAGRKRKLGDLWAWSPADPSLDITPLNAASLALWGFNTEVPPEPVKQRSGRVWGA